MVLASPSMYCEGVGIDTGIEAEFDPARRRPFHSPLTALR